ncbi:MAG: cytochrome c [Myxococcota bacterium]
MTLRALFIGMALAASPILVACNGDDDTDTDGADTDTDADIDGAAVYASNCAACHGSDGTNGTAGPSLADRVPGKDAAAIEDIVRNGSGNMAGFDASAITDEELTALATYTVSEWGP